jgi:hypothetical protein
MAFKRRNDTLYSLFIGITGVYVSATFETTRVASIGIIVLAGIGLYEITRSILVYRATRAPNRTENKEETQSEAHPK